MNERKTFLCIGLLPLFASSLLLLAITFAIESGDIEAKVKVSSEAALKDPKFNWVGVATHNRGRQVLLTGSAPSKEAITAAKDLVATAAGVLSVSHNGEIIKKPDSTDSSVSFDVSGEYIAVKGQVANQNELDSILNQLKKYLPNFQIENQLTLGSNLKNLQGLYFLKGLAVPEQPSRLTIKLRGRKLTVNGYVPSQKNLNATVSKLKDLFTGDVDNNLFVNREFCNTIVSQVQARGKINFAAGKTIIDEASYQLLNDMVSAIERCPETIYEVGGHTDDTGNYSNNLHLSERRADAVAAYLVSAGLPASQFKIKGYGPDRPIADNGTEEGRHRNRRIELEAYK
ncbi:MAG: OmpA family protein [Gammaproteobacteria bacterium]|nr:OmpA family protein [Gammaproteobacteria bacterium]